MMLPFNRCDNCAGSVCFCDDYSKQVKHLHNEKNNKPEEKKKLQQTVLDFQSRYHVALGRIEQLVTQNDKYREALKLIVDKYWVDPIDEKATCSCCWSNLRAEVMGKHGQLNGDPCPVYIAHEALKEVK